MSSRPRLAEEINYVQGLAAVALFAVFAAVFLGASFGTPQGFPEGANITASLGYAMFNLTGGDVPSEGFLAAFEIIDVVLVAALVGAVMLARRDSQVARTDGGRDKGGEH